jgi:outer membrane protein OmpA-like peptidoglycan-associated protein
MRHLVHLSLATLALVACAGGPRAKNPPIVAPPIAAHPAGEPATGAASAAANEFVLQKSDTAGSAHGATASKIKPTNTEAAMKFVVVDKDKGPVAGVVVSLTDPAGRKYYTEETDAAGYAEVLVPVGRKYDLVYLSLGKRDVAAAVTVTDEPRQNIKLTLVYRGPRRRAQASGTTTVNVVSQGFVMDGVTFDSGKATIRPESFTRLDSLVEYLTYTRSARVEISGHTDNVGNTKENKALSEKRARACRDYVISKGIDGGRVDAVGYGDERPIAPNDTDEGRQQNRRIEVTEI